MMQKGETEAVTAGCDTRSQRRIIVLIDALEISLLPRGCEAFLLHFSMQPQGRSTGLC